MTVPAFWLHCRPQHCLGRLVRVELALSHERPLLDIQCMHVGPDKEGKFYHIGVTWWNTIEKSQRDFTKEETFLFFSPIHYDYHLIELPSASNSVGRGVDSVVQQSEIHTFTSSHPKSITDVLFVCIGFEYIPEVTWTLQMATGPHTHLPANPSSRCQSTWLIWHLWFQPQLTLRPHLWDRKISGEATFH